MTLKTLGQPLALIGALLMMLPVQAQEFTTTVDESQTQIAHAKDRGVRGLSLSTEQLEKMRSLKNQLALDTASKKAELKVQRSQMFDLLSKPTVDRPAVLALQSKINALKAELSDARLNFMLAAGDVLTAEQKGQMRERMLKRSVMGGFRHHRRGHCGASKIMKHRSVGHETTQSPIAS